MSRGRLRQLRFPPELRIPAGYPQLPAAVARTAAEETAAEETTAEQTIAEQMVGGQVPAERPVDAPPDGALADLATNLWRVGKKLAGEENGDGARVRRMASRHAQAARESLAEAGIEIQDHDGTPFHPGLSLDVIAYEVRPGTPAETVVETVRPSVYRAGRCIQTGQVIVGQPEGAGQE